MLHYDCYQSGFSLRFSGQAVMIKPGFCSTGPSSVPIYAMMTPLGWVFFTTQLPVIT